MSATSASCRCEAGAATCARAKSDSVDEPRDRLRWSALPVGARCVHLGCRSRDVERARAGAGTLGDTLRCRARCADCSFCSRSRMYAVGSNRPCGDGLPTHRHACSDHARPHLRLMARGGLALRPDDRRSAQRSDVHGDDAIRPAELAGALCVGRGGGVARVRGVRWRASCTSSLMCRHRARNDASTCRSSVFSARHCIVGHQAAPRTRLQDVQLPLPLLHGALVCGLLGQQICLQIGHNLAQHAQLLAHRRHVPVPAPVQCHCAP